MKKLSARVTEVQRPGIQQVGGVREGQVVALGSLPEPDYVVIEFDEPESDCFLFRYTDDGSFCGDTWHETLERAFRQAEYEFGLGRDDFAAEPGAATLDA